MTADCLSDPGKYQNSVDPLEVQGAELARLAAEQLLELRRAYPQQELPELLPNGPVLWNSLGLTGASLAARE